MQGNTVINVTEDQKSELIKFKGAVEAEIGETLTQGEALAWAAMVAKQHKGDAVSMLIEQ